MPEALALRGHGGPSPVAAATENATIPSLRGGPAITKQPHDKRSLDYMLRSALAGGAAGCAAKTLIAPLDRVKILFQASNPQFIKYTGSWLGFAKAVKEIRRSDGLAGLFRGHSATLLRIFPYAAVKFVAYEQFRAVLIRSPAEEQPWRRFLSGSLAGITSVCCTYPLEVIRVRLAFETRADHRSAGLRSICRIIAAEPATSYPLLGRASNFYRGFSPTILGMLPYAGMSFLTHDLMGDWLRTPALAPYTVKPQPAGATKKPVLKVWAELAAGGLAGAASQTVSYPLEVVRRRMQVGGARGEMRFASIAETAGQVWRQAGVRGFYVGLSIGYVKVIPMVATSFFVYERMKTYLNIGS
ncbi:mitochondrial carrier protein LEU5 [Geopyxis carbonaria]|nr:mitochondrial carrier protein LEU5 [Geopyxis carbonaria]